MGSIDVDEFIKAKLIKNARNMNTDKVQGWRTLLDDFIKSSYSSGKQAAFNQINDIMGKYTAEIKQMIEHGRFEDAERLSGEFLKYVCRGGDQ